MYQLSYQVLILSAFWYLDRYLLKLSLAFNYLPKAYYISLFFLFLFIIYFKIKSILLFIIDGMLNTFYLKSMTMKDIFYKTTLICCS